MATELKMTLLLRRAAFADSCVLQLGEPGYHTGTKEFKVGDGTTTWANLPIANKTQIQAMIDASIDAHKAGYYTKKEIDDLLDALEQAIAKVASDFSAEVTAREQADTGLQNQINTKLATETFNNWKTGHENDHAPSATQIASDIADAVAAEADLRKDADDAINAKIGTGFDDGDNTVAKKIEAAIAAAAADATSKADAAEADAIAEAERMDAARALTAANALSEAKTELEGKISGGNATTLQSAKDYTDEKVAAEALARSNADTALDNKITALRNEIGNLTNVMNFRGAVKNFTEVENPVEGDVITFSAEVKDGDEIVVKAGSEWVYSGNTWVEIGTASASDAAIADLKSRIDAAEDDIDQAQADILALGTNKLNASDFNTWKQGHEADHANKQNAITSAINTAKQDAITEAGKLDGELEAKLIGGDADTKYAKTIKGAKDYAKDYADSLAKNYDAAGAAATAEKNAKDYADSQDSALQTAIEGVEATAKASDATIAGAKKYAKEAANAALSAAEGYADSLSVNYDAAGAAADAKAEVIGKSGDAKTADTIYGAKAFATDAANTAGQNAINTVVGDANSDADSDTIKGVKKAYVAADTTVLNSAKAYADEKVTDAHKHYQTATVKDAAHDSATNPSFITSISIDKGHVTGATVRNLAEVLAAMEFIFDCGTSAN